MRDGPRTLGDELKEQFRRQWTTMREILANVPDAEWTSGDGARVPARLLYHILGGTETYARSTSYEEFLATRRFPGDWDVVPLQQLPDRTTAAAQVRDMEAQVNSWLDQLGDSGLMEADPGFPWAGTRKLGRAVYLLRHTQNHLGELNAELSKRGVQVGRWG